MPCDQSRLWLSTQYILHPDDANRAILGILAMDVVPLTANSATWWSNLRVVQVAPPGGQTQSRIINLWVCFYFCIIMFSFLVSCFTFYFSRVVEGYWYIGIILDKLFCCSNGDFQNIPRFGLAFSSATVPDMKVTPKQEEWSLGNVIRSSFATYR